MNVFRSEVFYDESALKHIWDLETIGITSNENSENKISDFLANNIKFEENRYEVTLP